MLTQILVTILILAVALLVAKDLAKTKTDDTLGHPDGSGHEIRPRIIGDTRGDLVGASFREPLGTTAPAAGYDVGRPARQVAPPGDFQPSRTTSPTGQGSSARPDPSPTAQHNQHVRSRLRLLVIIPAGAVAVTALCIVGMADVLSGTRSNSPISSVGYGSILLAVALGVVIVVVLLLAARATTTTARSVLQPLYRLRARALALAAGRPSEPSLSDVASPDEIGDIARALEQMHSRMSRLGGDEAGLRSKLDAMFVNLSHRSHTLVERQMRLIENLEQAEQDKNQRATLFRLNRIAARMYRDSQNLLVLAGHEMSSDWNQPMALTNVIRAAMAEVEEYERVSLLPQPEVAVSGSAVDDMVHLLAELIQNATSFSAGDMPVEIAGQLLDSGGALISITDRGVGMNAQEMAQANWRLENPPVGDVEIPKWIGLIVVARIAARRGVRVRLQPPEFGGLTALVWLPDELIVVVGRDTVTLPGLIGSATTGPRRGAHASAAQLSGPGAELSMAAARSANLAPAREETPSAPLGRQLISESVRASDQVPAATAVRPMAPANSAAAEAGKRGLSGGISGDQAATGQDPGSGQEAFAVRSSAPASPDGTALDSGSVMVPAAGNPAEEHRLPIYDSVESHWFQKGRGTPGSPPVAGTQWSSPADEGWRTAATVQTPTAGGSTAEGLPRRLPNANLVPGAIPSAHPPSAPNRSAADVRDRLARLQRGVTAGRAAASEAAAKPDGDDGS